LTAGAREPSRLPACLSVHPSVRLVKIEEKLLWRAYIDFLYRKSIFWVAAIFLLPVSPLQPPRRPFCLIFARTAQQSVLDGTNGLSSSKPCVYCRIVSSRASCGNLCDSTAFLSSLFFVAILLNGRPKVYERESVVKAISTHILIPLDRLCFRVQCHF